jgi:DNA processing protein
MGDLRSVPGLIALMGRPGIGAGTALALAERFPTLDQLRDAAPAERRKVAGSRGAELDVQAVRIEQVDTEGLVGFFDATFPGRLKHIPSPPAVLWFRGALPPNEDPALAVVGTREPTQWGVLVAQNAVESAGAGVSIISGLALGIDGTAHARALRFGIPTFAVLGGGVDSPTPKEHAGLAAEILEQGGGLIAEVPPGTKPSARTLVARNRLQAGLSDAVVVAQCGLGSGTMHTARFALLQGRPLIVPEPTGNYAGESQSQGNLALIKGNDRGAIKASPAEARRIGSRKVFADFAPADGKALAAAVATIYRPHSSAPASASEPSQLMLGDE